MKQLWTPWRMTYLQGGHPKDDHCIFCRKAKAENDELEHILTRGESCYITLNLYPYNSGHLMVIPNRHVSALEGLDDRTLVVLRRD